MNKKVIITSFFVLCFYSSFCQQHIIGMSKSQVQGILESSIAKGIATRNTVNYTSAGQETWIWNDFKDSLKYIPVFDKRNLVESCLIVPLTKKRLEKFTRLFNTLMEKVTNNAWITPPNRNGLKCLIKLMYLGNPDPTAPKYGFMIGEIQ